MVRLALTVRDSIDAAMKAGITIGVYWPKERRAEDGVISDRDPMLGAEKAESLFRTEEKVIESDGALIFSGPYQRGGEEC